MTEDNTVMHLMHEERRFKPPLTNAHIKNLEEYEKMYRRSMDDSDAFWLEQA
jgi:acetyl-CoA synthetase